MIINLPIKERRTSRAFSLQSLEKTRSSTLGTKSIEQRPASRSFRMLRSMQNNLKTDTPSLTVNAHAVRMGVLVEP
jgi:hypothetical protein